MCGIFGVWFRDATRMVDKRWLRDVNDTMRHRGPDDDGIAVYGNVGLSHRRLSIIDLASGHQPMCSMDGDISIVFNGEIYNYRELRRELESLGHVFITSSDTEVILRQYQQDGSRCVEKLRGMFAFAIWDGRRHEMLLARDRIGIKPLYYCMSRDGFAFSSEVKPLLRADLAKAEVNLKSLDSFLSLGWVPAPNTMFANIHKLPPGQVAVVRDGGTLTFSRYWQLPRQSNLHVGGNSEDAAKRFRTEMLNVVSSHLVSDVPVGAFLSGGIDSAAVVASMSRAGVSRPSTFSVGYRNAPEANELEYARLVAKHFNTDHHEYLLDPLDFFDSIDTLLEFCEEPVDEPAGVAMYQLSKLARQHVKVVLTGEGMDELMGGYPIYRKMRWINRLHPLTRQMTGGLLSGIFEKLSTRERYAKYIDWLTTSKTARYRSVNCRLTRRTKDRMYNRSIIDNESDLDAYFQKLHQEHRGLSELTQMAAVDITGWLPDCLLLRSDKMSMAASIELRVPFLDHGFVEFCMSLPDKVKVHCGTQKYLVKESMRNILPNKILMRKKRGFSVPISRWFRGELLEPLRQILCDRRTRERGYFRPDYVDGIIHQHVRGVEDHGIRLFYLLVLEMWHRKYVDRPRQ